MVRLGRTARPVRIHLGSGRPRDEKATQLAAIETGSMKSVRSALSLCERKPSWSVLQPRSSQWGFEYPSKRCSRVYRLLGSDD